MRKTVFLIAVALTSGCMVFAQKANVSKASNALYGDPVNYDEARAAIDAAKQDESTATDPKTWYVAGRIGYTMAYNEWNKRYLGQMPDAETLYTGLTEMYANYISADALDGKVLDKKGNPKYTQRKNIKGDFKEMLEVYSATGFTMFQNREYAKSYEMLNDYALIVDNPMFTEKDKIKVDSTYNDVKFYASYAALNSEQPDKALECLKQLAESNYDNKQAVYEQIANVYQAQGDTVAYLQALKDGIAAYPQSAFFIGSFVNYYIGNGDYKSALEYVDQVVAKDPTNVEYVNVKADLLIQIKDFDGAKAVINDLLAKDRSANALYLMGKCWTIEGGNIQDKAQDLDDNNEYNAQMAKAKDCYSEAIKYFEEAKGKMDATNGNYEAMLQTLKNLYMQLKGAGSAEYQAVDAELKAIQQ